MSLTLKTRTEIIHTYDYIIKSETVRRIAFGQWRYGAGLEADDPRSKQPFIRFVIGEQNLDLVPWRLIQAALENDDAIASALDAVIEMREQEAAEATESSD